MAATHSMRGARGGGVFFCEGTGLASIELSVNAQLYCVFASRAVCAENNVDVAEIFCVYDGEVRWLICMCSVFYGGGSKVHYI